MACSNGILFRYKVRIENEGTARDNFGIGLGLVPLVGITKVTGLSFGEEEEITLREQNKTVRIPTGVTSFSDIGMQFRVGKGPRSIAEHQFFVEWWADRRDFTRTIYVDITDRAWLPLFVIEAKGCSFKNMSAPDGNLGTPSLLYIDMMFTPYELRVRNALDDLRSLVVV